MPTLTTTIMLQRTISELYVRCPILRLISHDFTTERLKKGQEVIGHIRVRPAASTYDYGNGGYKNGANEARNLLVDVPFKIDEHIHVTVKMSHLNAIQDSKQAMEDHFRDSASVIGKQISNYLFAKIRGANFTHESIFSAANSDKDALNDIRKKMNKRGVPDDRFGIVSSDVAEALEGDARITNRYDDRSKDTDGNALMTLRNVAGFKSIFEQPDFPENNRAPLTITGVASTDVITTASDHGFAVGDRVKFASLTGGTGITEANYYYVESVPSTTTLKVSATNGGSAVNFSTDITDGTIAAAENVIGFFATREAMALKTGLPSDSLELAHSLGIPAPVSSEVVTDPDSGLSMLGYQWMEPSTMELYMTITCLYGAAVGAEMDSASKLAEPSGHILRSA